MSFLTFLTILADKGILRSFRLVLQETAGEEIPKLSRSELSEEITANNSAFSEVQGETSGSLNRRVILDLTLQQTLLAVC